MDVDTDLGTPDGALPAGAGVVSEHQHLLRAMDVIDEYSDKLGERLAMLMRPLIDQDLSVVFYDLTTVAANCARPAPISVSASALTA